MSDIVKIDLENRGLMEGIDSILETFISPQVFVRGRILGMIAQNAIKEQKPEPLQTPVEAIEGLGIMKILKSHEEHVNALSALFKHVFGEDENEAKDKIKAFGKEIERINKIEEQMVKLEDRLNEQDRENKRVAKATQEWIEPWLERIKKIEYFIEDERVSERLDKLEGNT